MRRRPTKRQSIEGNDQCTLYVHSGLHYLCAGLAPSETRILESSRIVFIRQV